MLPLNFLEELAVEWHEYQGYFTWRNVRYGEGKRKGREEIDVVAYHPEKGVLVHIETSEGGDVATAKATNAKFAKARDIYATLFPFVDADTVVQRAIIHSCGDTVRGALDEGIQAVSLSEFVKQIVAEVKKHDLYSEAVPATLPLLRTIQVVLRFAS